MQIGFLLPTHSLRTFPSFHSDMMLLQSDSLTSAHAIVVRDKQRKSIYRARRLIDHVWPIRADARPAQIGHCVTAVSAPPVARKEASTDNVPDAFAKSNWRLRCFKLCRRCAEPIHSNYITAGCLPRRKVVVENAAERCTGAPTGAQSSANQVSKQRLNMIIVISLTFAAQYDSCCYHRSGCWRRLFE